MRRRDDKGRLKMMKDDISDLWDLIILLLKLFILAVSIYLVAHYLNFPEHIKKLIIEVLIGKNCEFTCDKKDSGNGNFK